VRAATALIRFQAPPLSRATAKNAERTDTAGKLEDVLRLAELESQAKLSTVARASICLARFNAAGANSICVTSFCRRWQSADNNLESKTTYGTTKPEESAACSGFRHCWRDNNGEIDSRSREIILEIHCSLTERVESRLARWARWARLGDALALLALGGSENHASTRWRHIAATTCSKA